MHEGCIESCRLCIHIDVEQLRCMTIGAFQMGQMGHIRRFFISLRHGCMGFRRLQPHIGAARLPRISPLQVARSETILHVMEKRSDQNTMDWRLFVQKYVFLIHSITIASLVAVCCC